MEVRSKHLSKRRYFDKLIITATIIKNVKMVVILMLVVMMMMMVVMMMMVMIMHERQYAGVCAVFQLHPHRLNKQKQLQFVSTVPHPSSCLNIHTKLTLNQGQLFCNYDFPQLTFL